MKTATTQKIKKATSSQPTRGPWRYNTEEGTIDSTGRRRMMVATIDPGFTARDVPSEKKHLANARLIAAAPELLEACLLIIESHNNGRSNCSPAVITSARSAIAKAEGQ